MTDHMICHALSLTFNTGCPFTVVQYGQLTKSSPSMHLPQQLPILVDFQQTLCIGEKC